jgi:general secretion pathway protein G
MIYDLRNKFKKLTSYVLPHTSVGGFTLIELLIVIALLGVLASSLIVLINPVAQFQRARDAQRKADIRQIQSALEMYRSDVGEYPLTAAGPTCGGAFTNAGITYLAKVPCDPKGGGYVYTATVVTAYTLRACLENANDPQKDAADTCAGSTVSYTLLNP